MQSVGLNRLGGWLRLISVTGLYQAGVQLLGLLGGIVIIRFLPTDEYAFYTLAIAMIGVVRAVADGALGAGIMAQGGGIWQNREQLGRVVVAGLAVRRMLALVALPLAALVYAALLRHQGAEWRMTAVLVLCLAPVQWASLSQALWEPVLKLHQVLGRLQRVQVAAAGLRLALLAGILWFWPWAWPAVVIQWLVLDLANRRLRASSAHYVDFNQDCDPEVRRKFVKLLRQVLPTTIYYSLSAQVPLWLITFLGSTRNLAEVGALGRLSAVLALVGVMFGILVIPRFARLANVRGLLLTRFWQVQAGFVGVGVAAVGLVWLFPAQVLWVLGPQYAGLTNEVVLMAAGGCVGLLSAVSYHLALARGAVLPSLIYIGAMLSVQVLGFFLLDIRTVHGVLLYKLVFVGAEYLLRTVYAVWQLGKGGGADGVR